MTAVKLKFRVSDLRFVCIGKVTVTLARQSPVPVIIND